jgi:tetratricopeptide (TPR) repeat protein/tRNA A-37 threonylcarbamoyl transferase component Bud32
LAEGLPAQAGRYHLEGEIARGGMGVVLRAQDDVFGRALAVKVLLERHHDRPDLSRRFLEEAQLMGRMQHPGIPPVYDLGELPDGRPFFAMKLIQGRTLAELLKECPDPAQDLPRFLAMFGQLCQAVAYAHSRGILHRDLKPSNVMVGAFGEVQVMDWGLAKLLARGESQPLGSDAYRGVDTLRSPEASWEETQDGAVLGTPAYMAPEQARGEMERLDERADVFGLGAILCVLLTGKPPYVAPTRTEVYQQAKAAALTAAHARLEACGADDELVRLAKRCLAPNLAERLRHAGLVAEAVAAYQAQVQERLKQAEVARARTEVKMSEERKRRRLSLALMGALLLLLSAGAGFGLWYQNHLAQQEAEQVERDRERDQQRALQLAKAQSALAAALQEAALHAAQARQLTNNPESWHTTLQAARSAVQRAEALLAQEPGLAQEGRAQQVEQLRARLEADEKDWQLLAIFDQVRLEQSQWDLARHDFKLAEAYPRLKQALADYGLTIGGVKAEAAAARLRQRPEAVQAQVRAVLWECLVCMPSEEVGQKQWLAAVLELKADPWLTQIGQAVAKRDWTQIEQLAGQAAVSRYHPAVLVRLARNLPEKARASAVLLLRRTQQQYPGDFWVNLELAVALYGSNPSSGTARPARKEELPVLNEAVAFARVAVGLRPGNATVHNNLGAALAAQGEVKGAIACFTKALDLEPKDPLAHYNLGAALAAQGDTKGASASYNKALDLNPKFALAHYALGNALSAQEDGAGAIACYKKALDLDPKYAPAHTNLGLALQAQGDVKGAMACYTKALDLDPKLVQAHTNLGNALQAQGDLQGAIACYRQALELEPKLALAHLNLGTALAAQKDWKGAIACFKKALDLDPKLARAHGALGLALQAESAFPEARAATQQALQLLPEGHPLRPIATKQLQDCQRLLDLDARLTAILNGDEQTTEAGEQLALADLCRRYKKRFTVAVRFYQGAFAAKPKLTPAQQAFHRYNAACAAALAAAGQGQDASNFDAKEKTRLRQQALAWLCDNLKHYGEQFTDAGAKTRAMVQQKLHHWQKDPDFDSVRGKEALAKLPETERTGWQKFWAEVQTLLQKTQQSTK